MPYYDPYQQGGDQGMRQRMFRNQMPQIQPPKGPVMGQPQQGMTVMPPQQEPNTLLPTWQQTQKNWGMGQTGAAPAVPSVGSLASGAPQVSFSSGDAALPGASAQGGGAMSAIKGLAGA